MREEKMMKQEFIFLGPPACGKGTQTNMLSKYLGLPHVATGFLLRAEITKETREGTIAKTYIDKGQLVPVNLVGEIIRKKLSSEECKAGFVLDGYPRSLEQAVMLDKIRDDIDGNNNTSFKAIYFDIDTEILVERIIHRQSCPKCGEIYNIKFKPPKVENMCDKCGVALKTRADDNEEIANARFDTYYRETAPLIKFYENKGILRKIDANGTIEEVWKRLLEVVEE